MKHEHLRKARLNLQTLVTSQSAVASRAGRVYLHKQCLIDEVSLNKPRSILLQMSMFQYRSIQQMRSMILRLGPDVNEIDTPHDCKTWVRVPLPAPNYGVHTGML
jgi:hypothetical protein